MTGTVAARGDTGVLRYRVTVEALNGATASPLRRTAFTLAY